MLKKVNAWSHYSYLAFAYILFYLCVNAAVRADVAECLDLPDGL